MAKNKFVFFEAMLFEEYSEEHLEYKYEEYMQENIRNDI
jgi:hypothetical protein